MHELSIVMSIVDIAQQQANIANASMIDEIELDIGTLSGIEMDALEFAWKQGVKQTILENASKKINRIEATAKCLDCNAEFKMDNYYDACPVCSGHFLDIIQGKELRVKSLVVS
jgi:hydrogenase nickel incorporation protein HypA/HybF